MRTRIVTDSSAELLPSVAAALDIVVLPQRIQVGSDTVADDGQPHALDWTRRLARGRSISLWGSRSR